MRDAFRHGFNNALGMCVVLLIVGCLRELLATGAVFGNVILHNALLPLAALPAAALSSWYPGRHLVRRCQPVHRL